MRCSDLRSIFYLRLEVLLRLLAPLLNVASPVCYGCPYLKIRKSLPLLVAAHAGASKGDLWSPTMVVAPKAPMETFPAQSWNNQSELPYRTLVQSR